MGPARAARPARGRRRGLSGAPAQSPTSRWPASAGSSPASTAATLAATADEEHLDLPRGSAAVAAAEIVAAALAHPAASLPDEATGWLDSNLGLIDASALLWRLHLDGVDAGHRFLVLADAWAAADDDRRWYAFNDVHAVMAYLGAGRTGDAERLVEQMAAYVAGGADAARSNVAMTAEIGLPVARSLVAFERGDWAGVVATLAPIRRRFAAFGGGRTPSATSCSARC